MVVGLFPSWAVDKATVDAADAQPQGATFLVPVRMEPCPIPHRLGRWRSAHLFAEHGYERLLSVLQRS